LAAAGEGGGDADGPTGAVSPSGRVPCRVGNNSVEAAVDAVGGVARRVGVLRPGTRDGERKGTGAGTPLPVAAPA